MFARGGSQCEVQVVHERYSNMKHQNVRNNATVVNRAHVGVTSFIQNY